LRHQIASTTWLTGKGSTITPAGVEDSDSCTLLSCNSRDEVFGAAFSSSACRPRVERAPAQHPHHHGGSARRACAELRDGKHFRSRPGGGRLSGRVATHRSLQAFPASRGGASGEDVEDQVCRSNVPGIQRRSALISGSLSSLIPPKGFRRRAFVSRS
jgi:hypothetical protein